MAGKLIQKHGNARNLVLNLVLLGIAGTLLIRGVTFLVYTMLPSDYFLRYESLTIDEPVYACRESSVQKIQATAIREIYPYLPDSIEKTLEVRADVIDEIYRVDAQLRKIDDQTFTPIYEWKENDTTYLELEYSTVILPGRYQVQADITPVLPYVGKKEPIHVESNIFTVLPCNK